MTATLAEVRRHCMHPLWFDASDAELADYLGVQEHTVHGVRGEDEVRHAVDALHARDEAWYAQRRQQDRQKREAR